MLSSVQAASARLSGGAAKAGPMVEATSTAIAVLAASSPGSVAVRLIVSVVAPAGSNTSRLCSAAFTCAARPVITSVLLLAATVAPPRLLALNDAAVSAATMISVTVPLSGS